MERADEAGAEPERAVMDEADEECAACFSIASRGCEVAQNTPADEFLTHAEEGEEESGWVVGIQNSREEAPVRSH
jgi:hypothetical protein